eukprot:7702656-Lingulodinium_polyedra.AAC.1
MAGLARPSSAQLALATRHVLLVHHVPALHVLALQRDDLLGLLDLVHRDACTGRLHDLAVLEHRLEGVLAELRVLSHNDRRD